MNRRNVREFSHSWKVDQLHSSLAREPELWSPKTYLSSNNWVKFSLDSVGSNLVSQVIRISVHKSENLDVLLLNCDATLDGIPVTTLGVIKIRCTDLPGWKFHFNSPIERVKNGVHEFCVRLFVGEDVVQQSSLQNIDLRMLSRDIGHLLQSSEFSDLTLKTRNGDFKAHRAILFVRCPELLQILSIKEDESSSRRVLYTVTDQVLKILLHYWYLGRLDRIEIETGLRNAINTFHLDDLKAKLCAYPTSSSTTTCVRTSNHSVTWPIKIFWASLPKKVLTSPVFHPSHLCSLQLMLQIQTVDDSDDVQVKISLNSDFLTDNCRIEVKTAVVNAFEELIQVRSFPMDPLIQDWKEVIVLKKDDTEDILQDDVLALFCEVTIHQTVHELNENAYSDNSIQNQAVSFQDLTNLSDSLSALFVSGKFSDLTIEARGKKFKVHKAILSARAQKLFKAIKSKMGFGGTVCVFNDEEPDVLKSLLIYIYSARVDVTDSGKATKLFLSADKYDLGLLKKSCLSYIKSNITF